MEPIISPVLTVASKIHDFLSHKQREQRARLEARWSELLDMLSEYDRRAFDDQDWVSRMCLYIGFAGLPSEPTFEAIHEQIMTAWTGKRPRPAVPEGLYDRVRELARLRLDATKE